MLKIPEQYPGMLQDLWVIYGQSYAILGEEIREAEARLIALQEEKNKVASCIRSLDALRSAGMGGAQ